jgi:AraC-like DNA-binding protein/mannose-6-phosphate isomerase-like protein (cupin superfamily)
MSSVDHDIPDVFSSPAFVREANGRLGDAGQRLPALQLPGIALSCHHVHIAPGRIAGGTVSPFHQHLEMQFEFVLQGRMSFATAGGSVTCRQGQGVLVAPLLRHSWQALGPVLVLGVLVRADGDRSQAFLRELRGHLGDVLQLVDIPSGPQLGDQLIDLLAHPETIWGNERLLAVFQLWLAESLAQALPPAWRESPLGPVRTRTDYHTAICQRAVEFIQANASHPLRVEDVARQFGLSTRHLSRLLRRHEGLSFQQLLRRFRLQHAHRLLQHGKVQSVKEAALSSGFSSAAYFTHCFQREFQALPSHVLSAKNPEAG